MHTPKTLKHSHFTLGLVMIFGLSALDGRAQVSLTNAVPSNIENFNTLASTGTTNAKTTLPTGWDFNEVGGSTTTTYTGGTGSLATGDTYSYGTSAADRAFGQLRSGTASSTLGASYINNTTSTINFLQIAYTGKQWRLGAIGREDRMNFEYSTNATSLTTGTWIAVTSLDFVAPVTSGATGTLDGNATANRTSKSSSISSLSIAPSATFWIRWVDIDATGADDGLSIDDFTLSAYFTTPINLSVASPTSTENFNVLANSGLVNFSIPTNFQFYETGLNANGSYEADNGISTSGNGNSVSYGTTSATDRAFGSLTTSNVGPIYFGLNFKNNSGSFPIIGLNIGYKGEQWRRGTTAIVEKLTFEYSTNATSLGNGTWTAVTALDFSTPNTSAANGATDGNASPNFTNKSNGIYGLSIANGGTFWIRWTDIDVANQDDGLAIDDISITAVYDADVALSLTLNSGTPYLAKPTTLTLTATNNGLGNAATIVINSILPAGSSFAATAGTPSTGTYNGTNWSIPSLASGTSATLVYSITPAATGNGSHTFTSSITSAAVADFTTVNNTASTTFFIADIGEDILPTYMLNGTDPAERLQYMSHLRIRNLTPFTRYRTLVTASTSATDPGTATLAGGAFGIDSSKTVGSVGTTVLGYHAIQQLTGSIYHDNEFNQPTTVGKYYEFRTDANGQFVGWFALVPDASATFTKGNNVYLYLQLNDGADGTTIAKNIHTGSTIHVLQCGATAGGGTDEAVSFVGTSMVGNEKFVVLYDNVAGTGRPIYATFTENDGITTNFTNYETSVGTAPGKWGAIIPRTNNANGIRRVEYLNQNVTTAATAETNAAGYSGTTTPVAAGCTSPIVKP